MNIGMGLWLYKSRCRHMSMSISTVSVPTDRETQIETTESQIRLIRHSKRTIVSRPLLLAASLQLSSPSPTPQPMRVIEVNMEQRRNEGAGETGDPRENTPINGIVRHDSHMRKSGETRPWIEPGSPWWEASRLTAHLPQSPSLYDWRIDCLHHRRLEYQPGVRRHGSSRVDRHRDAYCMLSWTRCWESWFSERRQDFDRPQDRMQKEGGATLQFRRQLSSRLSKQLLSAYSRLFKATLITLVWQMYSGSLSAAVVSLLHKYKRSDFGESDYTRRAANNEDQTKVSPGHEDSKDSHYDGIRCEQLPVTQVYEYRKRTTEAFQRTKNKKRHVEHRSSDTLMMCVSTQVANNKQITVGQLLAQRRGNAEKNTARQFNVLRVEAIANDICTREKMPVPMGEESQLLFYKRGNSYRVQNQRHWWVKTGTRLITRAPSEKTYGRSYPCLYTASKLVDLPASDSQ
ncbi:hypothetical protein PR048_021047 [Dryococelus australis]|uniref:Uncharacterized protein n=1 Tax=Dryococelus australis TaxID=614101 RepID=A0ABQ9GX51_9NEOP|nr:hypothetical protein PR048_021047 [Dryococelus australis]